MPVTSIHKTGDNLIIIFNKLGRALAYYTGNNTWLCKDPTIQSIQIYGMQLVINYTDGTIGIATYTGNDVWNISNTAAPIAGPLIDTISPGHHITNPGGTIASGWQWHITNEGNRGGDDWNYSYGTNFTAPAAGTINHFDVSGVGMIVELVLDVPVVRTQPQQAAGFDQFGPIAAIHFEHCSASVDGHHNQGEVIGKSGNGYGAYPAHLHVHGQTTDTGGPSSSANRCCMWGFV